MYGGGFRVRWVKGAGVRDVVSVKGNGRGREGERGESDTGTQYMNAVQESWKQESERAYAREVREREREERK